MSSNNIAVIIDEEDQDDFNFLPTKNQLVIDLLKDADDQDKKNLKIY